MIRYLHIMKFNPIEGQYFWSKGYAYGTIHITKNADIKGRYGELKLSKLEFKGANSIEFENGNLIKN